MSSKARFIGCCGAYCKTCKEFTNKSCKGCKIGYDTGERDINKARCKIKTCCFRDKSYETCADCDEYDTCKIIQGFYDHKAYKYKKYKQATEFIKNNTYNSFFTIADNWKNAHGRYE